MEDSDGDELVSAFRYLVGSFAKSNLKFGIVLPPGTKYFSKKSTLKALTRGPRRLVRRRLAVSTGNGRVSLHGKAFQSHASAGRGVRQVPRRPRRHRGLPDDTLLGQDVQDEGGARGL
ncbi:hypothetical protein MTO96_024019 [Rhipicephalus appendiculatus]